MARHRPAPLTLHVEIETWPLAEPFRITGHTMVEIEVIVITLERHGCSGRAEAAGVYYRGDRAASMAAQIERSRAMIEGGVDHESLRGRSEEHTSELQSRENLVCRLRLEKT